MSKAVLAELANDQYPTSAAAEAHGERLWRKHADVIGTYGERDKGRVHSTIHCIAMLHDAGHTEAAGKLEQFLDWMTEGKPKKATVSHAESMAGGK